MVEMVSDEIVFQTAPKCLESRKCSLGFDQWIENECDGHAGWERCNKRVILQSNLKEVWWKENDLLTLPEMMGGGRTRHWAPWFSFPSEEGPRAAGGSCQRWEVPSQVEGSRGE